MLKFFIFFIVVQFSLFTLEQLLVIRQLIIIPFTQYIAQISVWFILLFDQNVLSTGTILQDTESGFSVSIESGCNGIEALIVLISAMLVFPTHWKLKLKGIVIGFFAVELLNIIRIITLFYIGQWNQDIFDWAHLYIWESLIMLDILIIFLWWIRTLPSISTQSTDNHAS
ncbi:MAG: exosortase H [Methylococcales bacterium]|nr:exosortase H [Methylococcales bacterium]